MYLNGIERLGPPLVDGVTLSLPFEIADEPVPPERIVILSGRSIGVRSGMRSIHDREKIGESAKSP